MSKIPWELYPALVVCVLLILFSTRIVRQNERGVVYRLGRIAGAARNPGLNFIIPFLERMEKVLIAVVALELDPQEVITGDNVSLTVIGVVYFRVIDAIKSEVEVDGYEEAIELRGASVLRQVIGASSLEQVLANTREVTATIQAQLDEVARGWGLEVQSIEIQDIKLPKSMQRAMAAPAEAEREALAKVAEAQGEQNSAELLRRAATTLGRDGLQLRRLQTYAAIGAEQNSVIVVDAPQGAMAAQATAGQIAGRDTPG